MSGAKPQLAQPPHSAMAEQAVLGGLMIDQSAFLKVSHLLVESDFYLSKHQFIYRAIVFLQARNEGADTVTVVDFLRNRNRLEQIGLEYVAALARDTASAANIGSYAKVIKEFSLLRKGAELSRHYAGLFCRPEGKQAIDIVSKFSGQLFALKQEAEYVRED